MAWPASTFTFDTTEIFSNNSEKPGLLADKHLLTFLLHSSYSSSRMYGDTVGRPADTLFSHQKKCLGPGQSSPAILLSPNSFDS